jgi:hypothetical protein
MALTAITLCASALIKIGPQPIASFEDGTAEGEVAKSLYPGVRDALLASHPWSFATTQAALPRLAQSPSAEFRYAFQLPPDFLRAISAGTAGRATGLLYRIQGSKLMTNVDTVALTHTFRPDEGGFPPFFTSALMARLAAEFCLPLTENTSRAELLARLAEAELRSARRADSQQASAKALGSFPLISVRG